MTSIDLQGLAELGAQLRQVLVEESNQHKAKEFVANLLRIPSSFIEEQSFARRFLKREVPRNQPTSKILVKTYIPTLDSYQKDAEVVVEELVCDIKNQMISQEEMHWKALIDATVGKANGGNNALSFSKAFTPSVVAKMRSLLDDSGVPPQNMVVCVTLIQYVPTFGQSVDISSDYDSISQGKFGNVLGLETYIDATRVKELLRRGEVYLLSHPNLHGTFEDHQEFDFKIEKVEVKGQQCWELTIEKSISIAINPKSVVRAVVSNASKLALKNSLTLS